MNRLLLRWAVGQRKVHCDGSQSGTPKARDGAEPLRDVNLGKRACICWYNVGEALQAVLCCPGSRDGRHKGETAESAWQHQGKPPPATENDAASISAPPEAEQEHGK